MSINKVIFKKGSKINLPAQGSNQQTLYFTEDTGELFKSVGNGLPLRKYSDVVVVSSLPVENIQIGKIYVVVNSGNIEIYVWDENWKTLVTGGQVDSERVDILFNLKNKRDVLTYDIQGNIIKVETTGDVTEVTDYEYDINGNITKETIQRQGKIIVNTFTYDVNGNIIKIDTVVA